MTFQFDRFPKKFLFLVIITAIYTVLLIGRDFLQTPALWDETHYWNNILKFSNQLFPGIDDLRDYNELSTPLPFIIFGSLEYLFHGGIFVGRLLNLILSLIIVFIIGWPSQNKQNYSILCLIGLLLCPYFLWHSSTIYTEMISCFWVLLGFVTYGRNLHLLSSVAFILGIASRQYMLVFPAAIAVYEFIIAMVKFKKIRRINLLEQWRWIAPLIAVLSIFLWIYLFQGLAPDTGIETHAPEVQKTVWAITPGVAINFIAFVGLYIVIPEFILFQPRTKLQILKRQWRKIILIAICLLLCFLVFPPHLTGFGSVRKIADFLPHDLLKICLIYFLSLLACIRFAKLDLISLIVLFNSLIMMKAFPWDKYVLPLAVVFWFWKSRHCLNGSIRKNSKLFFNAPKFRERTREKIN